MKGEPSPIGLRNALPSAEIAVLMAQDHDRYHLGWPCWRGREGDRVSPVLDGLTPDRQREAKLVAAQTVEDWKAAGCPCLDASRIKQAYLYLTSCPAYINKHTGPQIGADLANQQDKYDRP
jgi:hypothetical protein